MDVGKTMIRPAPFGVPPPFEARGFLHRARLYRDAAIKLGPDIINGEPNWPKWFLMTHAIELAIRSFCVFRADISPPPVGQPPRNHDLIGLYDYAVKNGLPRDPLVTTDLPHLSELHEIHYARYPKKETKPIALISQYDDLVDKLFADVGKAISLTKIK
jgi:hypothetical protein